MPTLVNGSAVFAAGTLSPEKRRALIALALFSGLVADVQDGLGPFLGTHLQSLGWTPDAVGWMSAVPGLSALLLCPWAAAAAARAAGRRAPLALAVLAVLLATWLTTAMLSPTAIFFAQILMGAGTALFAPAIAGLTLGLAGPKDYPQQLGLNEAAKHAGTCLAAAAAIALAATAFGCELGTLTAPVVMAVLGVLSLFALAAVPARLVDRRAARGLDERSGRIEGLAPLLSSPALVGAALALMFFHLGNAAMLPLLGQAAVARFGSDPTSAAASSILIAQGAMIPTALFAAQAAVRVGWTPLIVFSMAALPVRGLIAGFWADPAAIVPVQLLDGAAAGAIGVATPGLVAAILKDTGRVNLGLGLVLFVQGIGAALSNGIAGWIAARLGYEAAFLALAAAPVAGLIVYLALVARRLPKESASQPA